MQPLDMLIDMAFLSFSVNKLVHPCCCWERRIFETKRAVPGAGEGTALDEKVALDDKGFPTSANDPDSDPPICPCPGSTSHSQNRARQSYSWLKFLSIAAIDVPPSLGGEFAIGRRLLLTTFWVHRGQKWVGDNRRIQL